MIIYYSGSNAHTVKGKVHDEPEQILKDRANIMLSYYLIRTDGQKQHLRFPKVVKARRIK